MEIVTEKEVVAAPAVVVTPSRKSLRKDKAAAKFSGSAGLKAFDLAAQASETAPEAAKTAAKASSKPTAVKAKGDAAKAVKKADAKAAAKPAKAKEVKAPVVTVPFVPRLYTKGAPIYALDDVSRPGSGRLLLAHTHAALTVLGLLDAKRPAAKKAQLLTLIGQRAVNYHLGNGNFEAAPDHGVRLSILGLNSFNARVAASKIDTEAATAYQAAFLDGKPDGKVGIKKDNLYAASFN